MQYDTPVPMTLPPDLREAIERLLGADAHEVLSEGLSVTLLHALDGPVTAALNAERAPIYLTLLHAMVLLRRNHELEPLHDDLFHQSKSALRRLDPEYGTELFAQDLAQLEGWGAVTRVIEPARVRSYKDIRRERFRHRLTDDSVALVEWLEARLRERLQGRPPDGRDLLVDIAGRLMELKRLVDHHRSDDERDADAPRRSVHLLAGIDEQVGQLSESLLGFRASMLTFAGRPYDLATLGEVLRFLETYVDVTLRRIEELRSDLVERLRALSAPRYLAALASLDALWREEGQHLPAAFGGSGRLRPAPSVLGGLVAFFAEGGQLSKLCAGVDEGARQVLRKMRRRLRELERRSQRVQDLRACVRAVAADELPRARLVRGLIASAHSAFGSRGANPAARSTPPLPRRHGATSKSRTRRSVPLKRKQATPAEARELRAARLAALRRYLEDLIGDDAERVVSTLEGVDAGRWIDIAKARHLGGGRDLAKMGFVLVPREGAAQLGVDPEVLEVPDARLERS